MVIQGMDEWAGAGKHRWMLDKLLLSEHLGYTCGPVGAPAPKGKYIVRPVMNILGMGREASVHELDGDTDHLPAGQFWCEWFDGEHLSVDYTDGEQGLTALGVYQGLDPICWIQTDHVVRSPFPNILGEINVEFIGGNVIEINFRHNQDFRWGNTVAIPIRKGMKYEQDPDHNRMGFFIDYKDR